MSRNSLKKISIFLVVLFLSVNLVSAKWRDRLIQFADRTSVNSQTRVTRTSGIDPQSMDCLSCHNGTHATFIKVKDAQDPMEVVNQKTVNHPIGMNYEAYYRKEPSGFTPTTGLNPEIVLVDGKVGCLSCHSPRNESAGEFQNQEGAENMLASLEPAAGSRCDSSSKLTVSLGQSGLCMACHSK